MSDKKPIQNRYVIVNDEKRKFESVKKDEIFYVHESDGTPVDVPHIALSNAYIDVDNSNIWTINSERVTINDV